MRNFIGEKNLKRYGSFLIPKFRLITGILTVCLYKYYHMHILIIRQNFWKRKKLRQLKGRLRYFKAMCMTKIRAHTYLVSYLGFGITTSQSHAWLVQTILFTWTVHNYKFASFFYRISSSQQLYCFYEDFKLQEPYNYTLFQWHATLLSFAGCSCLVYTGGIWQAWVWLWPAISILLYYYRIISAFMMLAFCYCCLQEDSAVYLYFSVTECIVLKKSKDIKF